MKEAVDKQPFLPIRAMKRLGKALYEGSPKIFIPVTIFTGVGAIDAIDKGNVVFAAIDLVGSVASAGITVLGIKERSSPPKSEVPERIIYLHRNKKRRRERKKLKR